MSFGVDVSNWVEKAKANPEKILRGTSIKLFSAIVTSSPVDEGTFRNNWYVSGANPSSEVDPNDTAGSDQQAINRMTNAVRALKVWNQITFTNNLPYANVIEFGGYKPGNGPNTKNGYSLQAPAGVVMVNSTRFQELIDEEAAKVR